MTPVQASLFDAPATAGRSRKSDPVTSVIAGKAVDTGARKAEVLRAMRRLGRACTASEIHDVLLARGSRMDIGSVRSRLVQLRDEDPARARVTGGVRVVPKPIGTGRAEQLWDLTDAAVEWFERVAS